MARFQFTINQLTDISRLRLAHVGPAAPADLVPAIVAAGGALARATCGKSALLVWAASGSSHW